MICVAGWTRLAGGWAVATAMLLAACGGGRESGTGSGIGFESGAGSPPSAAEKRMPESLAKTALAHDEELPIAQHADGAAASARFLAPKAITVDSLGNQFVIDEMPDDDWIIRKITPEGHVSTLTSPTASVPDNLLRWRPVTPHATTLSGIVVDSQGVLYVSNTSRGTIEKVEANGMVSLFAGTPNFNAHKDGLPGEASLYFPGPMAIDAEGTIYITDESNRTVRKISPAGVVTTLAGTPALGGTGWTPGVHADGTGRSAQFMFPQGIAVDAQKNLYVRDTWKIRQITPAGVVTTLATSSSEAYDGGNLGGFADGLAIDLGGFVVAADGNNHVLRKVSAAGQIAIFSGAEYPLLSGVENPYFSPALYEDGPPASARFGGMAGIAMASQGELYVVDGGNYVIRKVDAAGNVTTQAGARSRPDPNAVLVPS